MDRYFGRVMGLLVIEAPARVFDQISPTSASSTRQLAPARADDADPRFKRPAQQNYPRSEVPFTRELHLDAHRAEEGLRSAQSTCEGPCRLWPIPESSQRRGTLCCGS